MRALLVGIVVLVPRVADALEHPPLLEAGEGCEKWLGGASGNDASIRLNMILCVKDGAATGYVQWSSLVSGWNVREIVGTVNGARVELRDTRIKEERPEPGWRFCTIDRWALTRDGNRLDGTYDSEACTDHATVWFERIVDPASGSGSGAGSARPTPPPKPPPPKPPDTKPPAKTESKGCRCASGDPGPGDLVVLLIAWTIAGRRRPRAGRHSSEHRTHRDAID
jgi:hypothetical protein